jgi:hypothetical protein
MNEEIRFEVGEKYENMKGVFEVVAIHRDQMEIRWENGEEISTPIALQQRIIERMQHEKEMEEEQQAQKKKAKTSAAKASQPFAGFESSDFNVAVSKTNWRGRGQLGGLVTRQLSGKTFKYNSWAVLRKPEIQWLDSDRQKQSDLAHQAKFYARVDAESLFFGFQVPHTHPAPETNHWNRILKWLGKPENDTWLMKQCIAHNLYFCDLSGKGFNGRLFVQNDRWGHCQNDDSTTEIDSLGAFLSALDQTGEIDLRIERCVDKQAAIEKKQSIAADLAALFGSLTPLYAAAATGT